MKKEVAAQKRAKFSAKKLRRLSGAKQKSGQWKVITTTSCPDNGVDYTVMSESLVKRLVDAGMKLNVKSI